MSWNASNIPDCWRTLSGSFEWEIVDYIAKAATTNSPSLVSPTFRVVDTTWSDHPTEYLFRMSLLHSLVTVKCLNSQVPVRLRVGTVGEQGKRGTIVQDGCHTVDKTVNFGYTGSFNHEDLLQAIVSDTLTIGVEVAILVDPFMTTPPPIWDDNLSWDLALKCGTETFACHKAALSAHSSVFEEMFEFYDDDDTKLTIPEVEPIVVKKMLEFIYFNNIDPAFAGDLYVLAHKFDMFPMKKQSACALAKTLSTRNVLDVLAIFKAYGCEETGMEDYAYKYAARNFTKVLKTPTWSLTKMTHPAVIQRVKKEARWIRKEWRQNWQSYKY